MSGRRPGSARGSRAVLAVLAAVLSVLTGLVSKPIEQWASRNWPWLLGLCAVVLVVWLVVEEIVDRDPIDDLDVIAAQLAGLVSADWRREADLRQLDPHAGLVPFQWSLTGLDERAVTDVPALIDAFDRAPSRRLAIIGAPGSGKTSLALLLTLGLVERRMSAGSGPVPVKLSVANWDPREQGLMTWLEEELSTQFLFLRDTGRYVADAPERLLASGRVLPVLDGLDELRMNGELTSEGVTVRREGIRQIRRVLAQLPGLIVTCRADQFEEAMAHGPPIPGTMVVTLRQPAPRDVAGYLAQVVGDRARWEPVLGALRDEPDGTLAGALSTPLMVALARDVYEGADTEPAELLDTGRFPTAEHVRSRLLTGLVPAVFPDLPAQDRRTGWHGADAVRWLGFLAAGMTERNLRNITWWTLPELAGRPQRVLAGLLGGLIVAVTMGLGLGGVVWLKWGPPLGLLFGGLTALAGGLGMAVPAARNLPAPSELQFGGQGRWQTMLLGSLFAALTGGAAGWILEGAGGGVLAGAIFGVPLGLVYGGAQPDATVRVASPRTLLRRDLRVVLFFGVAYGLTSGGAAGWLIHPVFGVVYGVCSALCGGLLYGLPWVIALRAGRAGVVASVHLALYTLIVGPRGGTPPPWRLMRFLDEAHRRGVLRQVGPVYQFRHAYLQEALAESVS